MNYKYVYICGMKTTTEKQSNYNKTRADKLRKAGLCERCLEKKQDRKATMCNECRTQYRVRQNETRQANLEINLCKWCGVVENIEGRNTCIVCVLKSASLKHFGTMQHWAELLDLFVKQDGTCPYTGEKLRIGLNCSLDHIVCSSKGGENGIANMQWVQRDVNDMKGSFDNERFMLLCKTISSYVDAPKNPQWDKKQLENLLKVSTTKKAKNQVRLTGELHGGCKLTEAQVKEIRDLFKKGEHDHKQLSDMYNVTKSAIGAIIRRTTWKHIREANFLNFNTT